MNILSIDPRLPTPEGGAQQRLVTRLYDVFRSIAVAVNGSYMWDSQGSTAPTTGTWAIGQMVKKTNPVEAGSAGSKYIIIGWVCVSNGAPGIWNEMRVLTGG